MADKENILNTVLKEWYLEENRALCRRNANLQHLVRRMEAEVLSLANQLVSRNHHIARLQQELSMVNRRQRVLVDLNGSLHIFQRNDDGIYQQLPEEEDDDITDDEHILYDSEEALDIARRLGFETDSDYESDDLMNRLMGE